MEKNETDYRGLITNLHCSVHDDVTSARSRLHEAIELLEQGQVNGTVEVHDQEKFTASVADLRLVDQRLADLGRAGT
ncbi:hypothetical protein D2E65_16090 [Mycobacteroides abscessus]|uniref:hypothetical protein n=1 Tax=Mycobacteroides abscessus TaxID=36809 RepID=UPI000E6A0FCE|nr:hypothetical protein [Mycobacteroides abscessus]RIR77097.1 hypothetical protein D2E65_16090 [Mycobacteroides abscessus]